MKINSIFQIMSIFVTATVIIAGAVDFKLTQLDSSPLDLVWCGASKDTVLVLTETNSLYMSNDKGFSWKKLNDVLTHTGKEELEQSENDIGKVSKILESPVDKNMVIFLGTHGINWIGEDCGRKIKALNHGRNIQEYIFHPTERNWGLASAFSLCDDFKEGEPCHIYKELYVTKDLGDNWDLLISYVVQFGWGITGKAHLDSGIPKERILLTYEPKAKGDQKHVGWNYKVDFIYSDDFLKSKRVGIHKGNRFLLTDNNLFVAQVADQDTQDVNLLTAYSKEKHYEFQQIETTAKVYKEHAYTFLDYSEHSVFLHINHFGDKSKYGHIYASDWDGLKYSVSLKYNLRTTDNKCDFERIANLEGIFIANVIGTSFMENARDRLEEEALVDSMESQHKKKSSSTLSEEYKDYVKSLITFNKGGSWQRILAPKRDVSGKLYECGDYCFLNIHGLTGDFPHFYSVDSAAGLIIGNGNVGRYLSNLDEQISTFLSRDGGLNWFEIRKGSHIYEIGDHGGLIVIADDQVPTDTILYSLDEGLLWQEIKLKDKIMVKNIIIEPMSTSQHLVVYGEITKNGEKKGIVVGLNFSTLSIPQCKNPDQPDTPESDYEKWSPNDGRAGHECLMGQKITYIRRKRETECFNGLQFERRVINEKCTCTEHDYECDIGYARNDIDQACTPIDGSESKPDEKKIYEAPAVCNGYYTISKGYRKVPGNQCINGIKYDPIIIPCPSKFFSSLGTIFAVLIALVVVSYLAMTYGKGFFNSELHPKKTDRTPKKADYLNIVKFLLKLG